MSLGFVIFFSEIFVYVAFLLLLLFVCLFVCFLSSHRGSHIPSSWKVHAGCDFWLPAFTLLSHERQGLLSPCEGMQVCTDYTSGYTLV